MAGTWHIHAEKKESQARNTRESCGTSVSQTDTPTERQSDARTSDMDAGNESREE